MREDRTGWARRLEATILPNGWQAIVAIQAVLRSGGALVPLNPTLKPDRLAWILEHSGARLVVGDASTLPVAASAAAEAGAPPAVVALDGDAGDAPSLLAMGAGLRPAAPRPTGHDLAALI